MMSSLFRRVFTLYARYVLRKHFAALWVRGALPVDDGPIVVAVQHVGWWDPFVIFEVSRGAHGTHQAMMDAANLQRFRFFGWLGAFPVDRSSRARLLATTRDALARLTRPSARVWMFPQGRFRPADARPLGCEAGADWLARRAGARIVPIAIRYEFREEQRPEIFVSIGEPRSGEVESLLTVEADRLRDDVWASRLDGFDRRLRGRRSISDLISGGRQAPAA